MSPFEHVAQKKLSEARRAAFQFSAWSKPSRRTDSEHSRKRRIHLAFVLSTPSEIASPASPIAHGRCERIFCEKESGAKDDRLQLKRLLKALKRDDVVIVSALDRLRRGGPFKTLSILNEITSRGAAYRSLAEPWADTTHEHGEVLAALVGYIACKTRGDIIRRTTAGRERAKANGVKFGPKPKLSPAQRRQALGPPRRRGEPERNRALLPSQLLDHIPIGAGSCELPIVRPAGTSAHH